MLKNKLRLCDLENLTSEEPNYAKIMREVLGYNNYWIGRKYVFAHKFKLAHKLISEARLINPKEVEVNKDCKINIPNNIDNISFRAMMELQTLLSNGYDIDFSQTVAQIISIVCFQENFDEEYNSNSKNFIEFRNTVLNSPIWDMMGIYNWIYKAEVESKRMWNERFISVQIEDPDYEQANGHVMQQFNVINTLKTICNDFNVDIKGAWQVSYALSQTNSYEKASANSVKDKMRILKEAKMKKNRAVK